MWMFTQGGHLFDSSRPSTLPEVDDVLAVNPSKDTWTIVVKVNRMWVSPCFGGSKLPFSMELVFMDAKGCKIHATVRKSLLYRFQPLITEGRVYQISYFSVGENGGEFRTTMHTYKINFEMHTTVRLATNTLITMSPYSFTPLSDIRFNVLDSSYLTGPVASKNLKRMENWKRELLLIFCKRCSS
ncbi:replication protein A 70 kDa DNA-binding subunit B-like [Lotus japonicus]|uniref:replication protein A 70 kDa DNA-binding subunit B-like n=1 Tax=Lotus japonicus TaxID=34305 RepID=UPI002587A227|nr:replication protein A 70 kDa DNA-binding subunit B-like [Lotus japonicus]